MKAALPILAIWLSGTAWGAGFSLRFYGHGVAAPDLDRVKIPLQTNRPVDVGGTFTIEFWMKAATSNNLGTVTTGNDGWITGNILLDRDVYGDGDYGDWGISLGNGRLAFGVNNGTWGKTIVGTNLVANQQWRHVAVTRNSTNGQLRIFVDGVMDAQGAGPTGDLSYRDGRMTSWPNSDPFLVLGAEKHDAGAEYPSYNGGLDELRVSTGLRYTTNFARPTAPFTPDAQTAALYHFDEGSGEVIGDATPGGPSPGVRRFGGGGQPGPEWSGDTPFAALMPPTLTITPGLAGTVNVAWAPANTNWVLQVAPEVTGAWTNSPTGWTNPVSLPAPAPQQFFRLVGFPP